jgi:hypothetical protein
MRLLAFRSAAALTLSIAVGVAACAPPQGPAYQTGQREPISLRDDGDECGQSLVQSFVGLRANDTLRGEIASRSGAKNIRWIPPGTPVTRDFRVDRLNAELDEDDVIVTLRCG